VGPGLTAAAAQVMLASSAHLYLTIVDPAGSAFRMDSVLQSAGAAVGEALVDEAVFALEPQALSATVKAATMPKAIFWLVFRTETSSRAHGQTRTCPSNQHASAAVTYPLDSARGSRQRVTCLHDGPHGNEFGVEIHVDLATGGASGIESHRKHSLSARHAATDAE